MDQTPKGKQMKCSKPKSKEEFDMILNEVNLFSMHTYNEAIEKIKKKFSHLDPCLLEMFVAKMAVINSRASLSYYLLHCDPSERKREFDVLMIDYEKIIFDQIAKLEEKYK